MPFQGKTVRAKGIVPAFSTIRQKLPKGVVADIAGHLISLIKNGHYPQEKVGN
jgi:hypothetical protein